jgi:serine/threonine protein kinase
VNEAGRLEPGTLVLERYRIVGLVAVGGMSTVYEVQDERLAGRLVLKELRDLGTDPDIQAQINAQFEREAQTLARLSHRYLPRVIDCFYWQDRRYLVEDLVEGRTLEALMTEQAPRQSTEVMLWAGQICEALQALHDHSLVYRDLKPSNVMVTANGEIRLIDFGIVRSFALGKSRDTVVMGTPGFAAPEQYGTQQTDPRSDIYSLGVLMHHLLTGYDPAERPFMLPAARDLNPLVDERLSVLVGRAVQLQPEKRFASAEALRLVLAGQNDAAATTETFGWSETPQEPIQGAVAGCAALSAVSLWRWDQTPVTGAMGSLLGPFFIGLMTWCRREQLRLSASRIQVDDQGISLSAPAAGSSFLRWQDVQSFEYVERGVERRIWMQLRSTSGTLRFPIGSPRIWAHLLHFPQLEGSDRLGEVILDRAGLRPEVGTARWIQSSAS